MWQAAEGTATYSAYANERGEAPCQPSTDVLPQVDKMRRASRHSALAGRIRQPGKALASGEGVLAGDRPARQC